MLRIPKAHIRRDGKVLALKRALTEQAFPGLWDFPGGRPEPGDVSPQATLRREAGEETSLDITVGEKLVLLRQAVLMLRSFTLLCHLNK